MVRQLIQLCIVSVVLVITLCQEYKVIRTSSGKVRGVIETYNEEKMYQFRGIPYAKPPVGDLRFRKPRPYGSWEYTLDATKDTSPCMQPVNIGGDPLTTNDKVSEDCLFLNIHVPRDVDASNNKAVMVWIHGGGLLVGQGAWYDGSYLAMKGDVIVVTINYRLGIFGFLSTFDQASLGNYGLWDQRMAIEWVKSNIAAFGGNPSSITIFGQSAGGFSVSYQSIIPYNRGLFQRVIAQSGVSLSTPIITESDDLLDFLQENLYCSESSLTNTHALVECLRQKPAEELSNISTTYVMMKGGDMSWRMAIGPSLDGDLFLAEPDILLSDKSSPAYNFFRSLDYMAGTTDGEASIFLLTLMMTAEQVKLNATDGIPTSFLCDVFSHRMAETYFKNTTGIAKALCEKYKVGGGETDKMIEQGIQTAFLFSDLFYMSPTMRTLIVHNEESNERNTFHYLFTRAFQGIFGMVWPSWFNYSGHGTELGYLFGAEQMARSFNLTLTDGDFTLEDKMYKYWSNFAKYGDPNSDSLPTWKEYGEDQNYLILDREITSDKKLYSDRMTFLQEEMPKIVEKAASSKHDEL